jgi:hypothetical protein
MACIYEVWEIGGSRLDSKPLYRVTRTPRDFSDPPFSFCEHSHEAKDEAAKCRDFARGA